MMLAASPNGLEGGSRSGGAGPSSTSKMVNAPMLTVDEALRRVLDAVPAPKAAEQAALPDALGRVLAASIVSREDVPAFARATMDGYAVRSDDLSELPAELLFSGESAAGSTPGAELPPGGAFKVMTGAPVPAGADAVVPIEKTEPASFPGFVRVLAGARAGSNVAAVGSEVRAGETLLEREARLGPAEIALLALLGRATIPVWPRPRVAILPTGDELVPHDSTEPPPPGRVRNSNGPMLAACLATAGIRARDLGIARDDSLALRVLIREGLRDDVLVLSGGVSIGEKDLVAEALRAEGVEILFHRVALKPGKPLLFGRRGSALVFGLPGNPLSSFVGFHLFVLPALRALEGEAAAARSRVRAVAREECPGGSDREEYRPARADLERGEWRLTPFPWKGSAHLPSLCRANALQVVPIGSPPIPAGAAVEAILLRDAAAR
jgi:molybdopterin molybdotransferase